MARLGTGCQPLASKLGLSTWWIMPGLIKDKSVAARAWADASNKTNALINFNKVCMMD